MIKNEQIPSKSIDLIKLLTTTYPDKMILDNSMSESERFKLAGKVELIRYLKSRANVKDS